jgi:hypothetical protein
MTPIIEMNNLMDDIPPERVLEIKSLANDFANTARSLTQREIVRLEWLLEKAYVAGREDTHG